MSLWSFNVCKDNRGNCPCCSRTRGNGNNNHRMYLQPPSPVKCESRLLSTIRAMSKRLQEIRKRYDISEVSNSSWYEYSRNCWCIQTIIFSLETLLSKFSIFFAANVSNVRCNHRCHICRTYLANERDYVLQKHKHEQKLLSDWLSDWGISSGWY